MFAAIALQQIAGIETTMATTAARSALESVRPALLKDDFAALGLRSEAIEECGQAHSGLELDRAFLSHGETPWNQ